MLITVNYMKNKRKNSKILKQIYIYKLGCVEDFIEAIATFTDNFEVIQNPKVINMSCVLEKNVYITNTNNELYNTTRRTILNESKQINFIEDAINAFYDFLLKTVNFAVPDLKELYSYSNIKYFINKYYKKEV